MTGVRSVQLALDVLETVAFAEREIGVSEVAAKLSTAKGAIHRHLQTLTERGYLVQSAMTARYRIGVKFELLGRLGGRGSGLFVAAEAAMLELRDAIGESVVLSTAEEDGVRVLATFAGPSMVEIGVKPGSLLTFDRSAQGKALLAFSVADVRERAKRKLSGAARANLERDVLRASCQGWLASEGEFVRGINAIAAPIFDANDVCVATVAAVGVFDVSVRARNENIIKSLLATARQISVNLGHRPAAGKSQSGLSAASLPRRHGR